MGDILEGIAELDALLSGPDPAGESTDKNGRPREEPLEPKPEPIGFVTRQLTGPDGSTLEVEVPVYAAPEATAETAAETPTEAPSPEDPDAEDADSGEPELEDLSELLAAEDAED